MQAEANEKARSQLQVVVHRRYNPEGISQYNIVPGLLGVILQMTMVMMTSMALTRETERGTMENLLAMPASPAEIMLGKILPYLGVGAVQVAVVLTASKFLFSVPFVGSMPLLFSAILAFVLSLVLLGYTISTAARTQMQAMQLTFFFFLPSLLLSGFMFPYRGMPGWAQTLGEIFPLTHFLRIIRAVMLKGADYEAIASEVVGAGDLHLPVRRAGAAAVQADAGLSSSIKTERRAQLRSSGLPLSKKSAHGSAARRRFFSASSPIEKSAGPTPSATISQVTGTDTVAPFLARDE